MPKEIQLLIEEAAPFDEMMHLAVLEDEGGVELLEMHEIEMLVSKMEAEEQKVNS